MATAAERPDQAGTPRPLRADARRNRERVLISAREVFASHGYDAQVDEIARHAGVGVGTVYRHFPTKEALLEALVADSFERIGDAAVASLENPDPWDAFASVLWTGAEVLAANRGLTEALTIQPTFDQLPADHMVRVHEAMSEVIRRGQEAGVIRADLQGDDVPMLMCGVGAATRKPHSCGGTAWRRHMGIVLDGLRATAATDPLPD